MEGIYFPAKIIDLIQITSCRSVSSFRALELGVIQNIVILGVGVYIVSDLKYFSEFPGNMVEIVAHAYLRPSIDWGDVRLPCEGDLIVICGVS